jgi:hydrogenase maturation protease
MIGGIAVAPGSRVVLRPRTTETDLLMRAVAGRRAIVDAVMEELDGDVKLTVTLEDDPARALGKARGLGHRFFFAPDELEPLGCTAPQRVLVAGIGNVFMGDDGFGVAVAARLAETGLPEGVDVVDFGIRGMDLAFALNDGYHAAILVDACPRGDEPGTVAVIEPELGDEALTGFQAHGMDPVSVLAFARQFGSVPERVLVVGCEPLSVGDVDGDEVHTELSGPVLAAVDTAVTLTERLARELSAAPVNPREGGEA